MTKAVEPNRIDALPPGPSTNDPDNFDALADAHVAALPQMITQQNAANEVAYLNALAAAESATAAALAESKALEHRDQTSAARDAAGDYAAAAAASAAAASQLTSTSATGLSLERGVVTFVTQPGAGYQPGVPFTAIDRLNPDRQMSGVVISYVGPNLTAGITRTQGVGSVADWNLSVTGAEGPPGPVGGVAGGTVTGTLRIEGSSTALGMVLTNAAERVTVRSGALSGTVDYDVTQQSVVYYTAPATGGWTADIRGSAGATLDTLMDVGQALSVVLLTTQGATAYLPLGLKVQGVAVTPKWQGGIAPVACNALSIDSYTYTVIKTAANTFTVLAAVAQFK